MTLCFKQSVCELCSTLPFFKVKERKKKKARHSGETPNRPTLGNTVTINPHYSKTSPQQDHTYLPVN